MQDLRQVNEALARIADRVPVPAKPFFASLLACAENHEIPPYVRFALCAAVGEYREEDAALRAAAVLSFGHPGCLDYDAAVAGAWRTLRSVPRADRRAALQGSTRLA